MMAISDSIKAIKPDNGFEFDLSEDVYRGRTLIGDDEPIPMVTILEAPIPLEWRFRNGDNVHGTGNWELLVQGFVADDKLNPTDPAHRLMAEVKHVLIEEKRRDRGRNAFGMGGKVVEVFVGQGAVRPPDLASAKAFFWLTLTLKLSEDLDNPYN
jgi:hypothetical protein